MNILFLLLDAKSCGALCVDEIYFFGLHRAWRNAHLPLLNQWECTSLFCSLPLWSAVAGPSLAASRSPLNVQLQCKNHHFLAFEPKSLWTRVEPISSFFFFYSFFFALYWLGWVGSFVLSPILLLLAL